VLVLELAAALALTWLAVAFEGHTRFRAFDMELSAQADAIFGAVGDADDPQDNVVLDVHSLHLPHDSVFEVAAQDGRILGRSALWPSSSPSYSMEQQLGGHSPSFSIYGLKDGLYRVRLPGHHGHAEPYRLLVMHAVRVVDPGDKDGGVRRPVVVLYGASTRRVWSEIWEAVRFYAIASLLLLTATGVGMSWLLRRSLAPLGALADEAARISAQQWRFHPQESARAMIELAPLTNALEAALQRLERSFAQQKRFTSDAAHELKTDLAIAKSSLQLLTMRRRTPEAYARGLEVCLADTDRLEKTVTEMLTLARVEQLEVAGKRQPLQTVDIATCLRSCVERFASLAELRAVRVVVENSPTCTVSLSEKDATLLCTNLLLNAMEYSRAGSAVFASLHTADACVRLLIRDEGSGIPPEVLPHVFEPFYRGDSARDRRTGGTGLGLAICKGICDQAGGSIIIESTLGAGTTVTVQLPQVCAAQSPAQETEAGFSLP
jgi:signal transduction histidine kinase